MAKRTQVRSSSLLEARVLAICEEVEELLGLGWIDTKIRFNADPADDQASTAATDTIWKYRYAHITWNLNSVAGCTDQQLLEVAVHEYVHVMMGALKGYIKAGDHALDMEEFATETIARSILGLLELA